jgi:hypothetical protein
MAWVESPAGHINIHRAQRISIEPNDQRPNEWAVLAHFGNQRSFLRSFPTRIEAGEFVADLLYGIGDDE